MEKTGSTKQSFTPGSPTSGQPPEFADRHLPSIDVATKSHLPSDEGGAVNITMSGSTTATYVAPKPKRGGENNMGYYLGGGLIGVDYKLKDSMQMHTGQIRGNLKLMIERERTWITLETAKSDGDVSLNKGGNVQHSW